MIAVLVVTVEAAAAAVIVGAAAIAEFVVVEVDATTVAVEIVVFVLSKSAILARSLAAKLTSKRRISALTKLSASGSEEVPLVDEEEGERGSFKRARATAIKTRLA